MRIHPVDTESELGLSKRIVRGNFVPGSIVESSFKEVSAYLAHFVKTWYTA